MANSAAQIFYSRKQAVVLHSIPVAIYLFMPFLLRLANVGLSCSIATFYDFIKDASHIVDTNYEFSVVDSNSLLFVFKHAPEVAKELHICSELSFETANFSHQENWMAIYPVSFLFSRSLKFSAKSDEVLKEYRYFPHLSSYKPQTISGSGSRKVYLELSLGQTVLKL